jgi:hypothetical protein
MKKLLTLPLLLLFSVESFADISGLMKCKVKSQKVMVIEDGIPDEYDNIKDNFEVGDTLSLSYAAKTGISDGTIVDKKGKEFLDTDTKLRFNRKSGLIHDGWTVAYKDDWTNYVQRIGRGYTVIHSLNYLYVDKETIISKGEGNSELRLSRYYKSDWDGTLVVQIYGTVQVATLDCRHTTDKFEEFVELIGSFAN